jgi:hypothetical protein
MSRLGSLPRRLLEAEATAATEARKKERESFMLEVVKKVVLL